MRLGFADRAIQLSDGIGRGIDGGRVLVRLDRLQLDVEMVEKCGGLALTGEGRIESPLQLLADLVELLLAAFSFGFINLLRQPAGFAQGFFGLLLALGQLLSEFFGGGEIGFFGLLPLRFEASRDPLPLGGEITLGGGRLGSELCIELIDTRATAFAERSKQLAVSHVDLFLRAGTLAGQAHQIAQHNSFALNQIGRLHRQQSSLFTVADC